MRYIAVGAAMLAIVGLASGAAYAQYPPAEVTTLSVSETVVVPGEPITISSDGWMPNSEVTITLESAPRVLATVPVGDDGAFTTTVTIPRDVAPGEHTLRVSGTNENGEPASETITITVLAARQGGIPFTGTTVTVWMIVAAGLLLAGIVVATVVRRRRLAGSK